MGGFASSARWHIQDYPPELNSKTVPVPFKKCLTPSSRLGARKALPPHAPGEKPVQRVTSRLERGHYRLNRRHPVNIGSRFCVQYSSARRSWSR